MQDKQSRLAELRRKRQLGTASSAELREVGILESAGEKAPSVPQTSSENVFVPLSARPRKPITEVVEAPKKASKSKVEKSEAKESKGKAGRPPKAKKVEVDAEVLKDQAGNTVDGDAEVPTESPKDKTEGEEAGK
jgi:hypothetical protein